MNFQELLSKVCRELPEYFQIVTIAENGYAGSHLLDYKGDEIECPEESYNEGDGVQEEVLELLRIAKL